MKIIHMDPLATKEHKSSQIGRQRRASKTILNPAHKKGEAKNLCNQLLSIPESVEINSEEEFIF